jgi:hypothetical protein
MARRPGSHLVRLSLSAVVAVGALSWGTPPALAQHDPAHAATPPATAATGAAAPARAAFERLKTLAGHWTGSMQGQPYSLDYRVASGGSVVMATLFPDTDHEMITMFHLDGDELVATHYCSGGNQPRMRFDAAASTADELRFAFVGGSNMQPGDPHIHEGVVRVGPDGKLHEEWAAFAGGQKADVKVFELTR